MVLFQECHRARAGIAGKCFAGNHQWKRHKKNPTRFAYSRKTTESPGVTYGYKLNMSSLLTGLEWDGLYEGWTTCSLHETQSKFTLAKVLYPLQYKRCSPVYCSTGGFFEGVRCYVYISGSPKKLLKKYTSLTTLILEGFLCVLDRHPHPYLHPQSAGACDAANPSFNHSLEPTGETLF